MVSTAKRPVQDPIRRPVRDQHVRIVRNSFPIARELRTVPGQIERPVKELGLMRRSVKLYAFDLQRFVLQIRDVLQRVTSMLVSFEDPVVIPGDEQNSVERQLRAGCVKCQQLVKLIASIPVAISMLVGQQVSRNNQQVALGELPEVEMAVAVGCNHKLHFTQRRSRREGRKVIILSEESLSEVSILDIEKYLERIDYSGSLDPSTQTVRALHRAHMLSVPFENLDIHLGRQIVLDEQAFFSKIVGARRGGFCYELNGLFHGLLRRLGFDVQRLSAGVARADGSFGPDFDHMTLMVRLDDLWLADVGFGDSFLEPISLNDAVVSTDPTGAYRVDAQGDSRVMLKQSGDGQF